jgi:PKD repeat protein
MKQKWIFLAVFGTVVLFSIVLIFSLVIIPNTWTLNETEINSFHSSNNGYSGNNRPIAKIVSPDEDPIAQEIITFKGSDSSDSDGSVISYDWDFNNDGIVDSTEMNPSYMYANSGFYTVKLTVTDNDHLTDSKDILVTVISPPDAIQNLIINVKKLNLTKDVEIKLVLILNSTENSLDNGEREEAIKQLNNFIENVTKFEFQTKREISQNDAIKIINEANRVHQSISEKYTTDHFIITYTTKGNEAINLADKYKVVNPGAFNGTWVPESNGIPDCVEYIGLSAEKAHNKYIVEYEYAEPISTDSSGKYPIEITRINDPISRKINGLTTDRGKGTKISISKDFTPTPGEPLEITVFHEYYHAIQQQSRPFMRLGYVYVPGWIAEGMAEGISGSIIAYPDVQLPGSVPKVSDYAGVYLKSSTDSLQQGFVPATYGTDGAKAGLFWSFVFMNTKIDFDNNNNKIPGTYNGETPEIIHVNDGVFQRFWKNLSENQESTRSVNRALDYSFANAPSEYNTFNEAFIAFAKANIFPDEFYPDYISTQFPDKSKYIETISLGRNERNIDKTFTISHHGIKYYHISSMGDGPIIISYQLGDGVDSRAFVYEGGLLSNEKQFMKGNEITLTHKDADIIIITLDATEDVRKEGQLKMKK